jgi:hypothetical protein
MKTTTTTRLNATCISTRHGKLLAPDGTEYRVVPRVRGQAIPWTLLRGLTEGDWISITAGIRQHGAYATANALILPKD